MGCLGWLSSSVESSEERVGELSPIICTCCSRGATLMGPCGNDSGLILVSRGDIRPGFNGEVEREGWERESEDTGFSAAWTSGVGVLSFICPRGRFSAGCPVASTITSGGLVGGVVDMEGTMY